MTTTHDQREQALAVTGDAFDELDMALDEVAQLTTDLAEANDEIERLQAIIDAGNPPLPGPVVGTTYGACPNAANSYSVPAVVAKFGQCDIRIFDGGKGAAWVPQRPKGAELIHASWKLFGKADTPDTPAKWDQFVARGAANLHAGDIMEAEHEHDVKYRTTAKVDKAKADRELEVRMKLKADLHDAVLRVRPDLRTASTVAVWTFSKDQVAVYDKFMAKATMLGVDFDGMQGQPDYTQWLDEVVSAAGKHYGGRWTVPEYGMTPGPKRIVELERQTPIIAEAGAISVMYWDDDNGTFGCMLTTPAEIDYWSAQCNQA